MQVIKTTDNSNTISKYIEAMQIEVSPKSKIQGSYSWNNNQVMLKEHILRQHAGWSGRSQVHLKYVHYFGNESSKSILQEYGILPKDNEEMDVLRPKQCPNCGEFNRPDQKF